MQKLTVKASKEYDIVIQKDFEDLSNQLHKVFKGKKILIVSDTNVFPLYGDAVKDVLKDFDVYEYVIKAGERSKNVDTYLALCEFLAENAFARSDALLALGGGVVGDLTGFAAASYMRGIGFIQCPTTLLACVDSSVGGKTAVNLPQGKNLLGAFYQPTLVYVALSTLKTLPQTEIANGMGEIVKYAFLSPTVSPQMLKDADYEKIICACLKIKADIVQKDEFEGGLRAILNLGHTVGHAIETLSGYTIPHGVCVAKGLKLIITASQRYYALSQTKIEQFNALLNSYPFDLDSLFTTEQLVSKMINDKKADGDTVKAVLIRDIGDVNVCKMQIKDLGELIK